MNILQNNKLVLFIAIIIAFIFPNLATGLKSLLIPLLILLMSLSIMDTHIGHITRKNIKAILKLTATHYILFSGLILLSAFLLIKNADYRNGLIILAAFPPAIAVVPLAYVLKADVKDAVLAEIFMHISSLIIAPIVIYLLLSVHVDILSLVKTMLLIIATPLVIARIFHHYRNDEIFTHKREVINILFGILFYVLVGVSRDAIIANFSTLYGLFALALVLNFGLGYFIYYVLLIKKVKFVMDIVYVLFGTLKNTIGAAAVALILLGASTSIPAVVFSIIMPFYIIFLEFLIEEHRKLVSG